MVFEVISNPHFIAKTGFTNAQFKKLDGLYLMAAAVKCLNYRTVECDFEEETARYTYYRSENQTPALQFCITRVGPKAMMYEVYKQGKGRIARSGVFDKAYTRLKDEVESLINS